VRKNWWGGLRLEHHWRRCKATAKEEKEDYLPGALCGAARGCGPAVWYARAGAGEAIHGCETT
jgi:hypothetical protein